MHRERETHRGDGNGGTDLNKAIPECYEHLIKLAGYFAKRYGIPPAGATSLVHRAYLKLQKHGDLRCHSTAHACGMMARAMRFCLVDLVRKNGDRIRLGRTKGHRIPLDRTKGHRIPLDVVCIEPNRRAEEILVVHEGLKELENVNPQAATIVELFYFGRFENDEIAKIMKMSRSTAKRRRKEGIAWLARYCKD